MLDLYDAVRMKEMSAPIPRPNLRTGVGRGHFRKFDRERPEKNAKTKKRKRSKMSKESRKRNRSRT